MNKSIATIEAPEFINLKALDINPLMSSCEIKVLYLGKNRNGSYIDKETATEMAKTLRGAPIVGYYKPESEDFGDHGQRVVIDDEGIKFECLTKPYGFVAPDARVWFQNFDDTDDFGNIETRTYLMTTGYLWTGQFKECEVAVKDGRPHSMELDEETLKGHWATDKKDGMDFFIINDAIFSKLCILGNDVEPCFEGSSVTAPKVSASFTRMDDDFKNTLFTMMQELKFALQGGQQMEDVVVEETVEVTETPVEDTVVEETPAEVVENPTEENVSVTDESIPTLEEDVAAANNLVVEEPVVETAEPVVEPEVVEEPSVEDIQAEQYAKTKDEKDDEEDKKSDDDADKGNSGASSDNADDDQTKDEEEDEKKKYELLSAEYSDLQAKYSELETKYAELVTFKNQVEDARKDEMIAKFCFLSDEDKKEVVENKSKYTLEEIESKLSVISVRKRVSFSLDVVEEQPKKEADITTYNLNDGGESVPAWVKALQNNKK